jgi:hypothetical protein
MMSVQELEKQLLSLDLNERRRVSQLLTLSLDMPATVELSQDDRTPQHPLRCIPIDIPADFNEPMTELG